MSATGREAKFASACKTGFAIHMDDDAASLIAASL